jgi:serine/threonine protein kinase
MNSLKDFEIICQIAEGSYASVYKAMQITTKKLYALKEMSKAKLIRLQRTEVALQEKKIHSSLQHRGIVQFIASFQTAQFLYIVLELAECGDLLSISTLNGISVISICKQLLETLFYLHNEAKVVHLDLKPENILLFPNGQVKICDFGCAQRMEEFSAKSMKQLGTAEYACPHLVRGEWEKVGFGCDLWSFGCIVWYLLKRVKREHVNQAEITREIDPKSEIKSDSEILQSSHSTEQLKIDSKDSACEKLVHRFSANSEYLSMKKVLEFEEARMRPLIEREILLSVELDETLLNHSKLTQERIERIVALISSLCPS